MVASGVFSSQMMHSKQATIHTHTTWMEPAAAERASIGGSQHNEWGSVATCWGRRSADNSRTVKTISCVHCGAALPLRTQTRQVGCGRTVEKCDGYEARQRHEGSFRCGFSKWKRSSTFTWRIYCRSVEMCSKTWGCSPSMCDDEGLIKELAGWSNCFWPNWVRSVTVWSTYCRYCTQVWVLHEQVCLKKEPL